MTVASGAVPVAEVVRNGVVESVHHGHVAGLDSGGAPVVAVGDPGGVFFPRSSLKPLQAVTMLRAGLRLDGDLLALACASHSGEPYHVEGSRRILAGAGLGEQALHNTPDWPLDDAAALAWRSDGGERASITQNCSGKHAAMLATCVAAGWDTADYLSPGHPLQQQIRDVVAELTDSAVDHVAVDGCGAPLFSCSVVGLARAFARIATAGEGTAEALVAQAIRQHPQWLGGSGRDVSAFIAGVPGLIAKDGAEGVYAAAMPDGRAVALKILDGSARPRPVVLAAALRALGVESAALDGVGRVSVLGHGEPVGEVRPTGLP